MNRVNATEAIHKQHTHVSVQGRAMPSNQQSEREKIAEVSMFRRRTEKVASYENIDKQINRWIYISGKHWH